MLGSDLIFERVNISDNIMNYKKDIVNNTCDVLNLLDSRIIVENRLFYLK